FRTLSAIAGRTSEALMSMFDCHVSDGDLVITNTVNGGVVWKGRPSGYRVWKVLTIPGSDDCLVLLEYWAERQHGFQNLLRVRADGSIRWRAELPDPTDDAYVGFEWDGRDLVAGSWSGFRVVLDPATGHIVSAIFVK